MRNFIISYTNETVVDGTFSTTAKSEEDAEKSFRNIIGQDAEILNVKGTYDEALRDKLEKVGRKIERKQTHQLEPEMIEGIIATLQAMDLPDIVIQQSLIDLTRAKFKIWDWLSMMYSSDHTDEKSREVFEQLVKLYINQEHVGGFAWGLRGHVDLMTSHPDLEKCEDCIKSYEWWHNATPEELRKDQEERIKLFGEPIDVS